MLQDLVGTVQGLVEHGDSPRESLDVETETYALHVRHLVQRKLTELQSTLPGGSLSDVGSGVVQCVTPCWAECRLGYDAHAALLACYAWLATCSLHFYNTMAKHHSRTGNLNNLPGWATCPHPLHRVLHTPRP